MSDIPEVSELIARLPPADRLLSYAAWADAIALYLEDHKTISELRDLATDMRRCAALTEEPA